MIINRINKAIEEEVQKRVWEEQRRREMYERFERLENRIAELEMRVYDLRMKADPEFRRLNTPTCSCSCEPTTTNKEPA